MRCQTNRIDYSDFGGGGASRNKHLTKTDFGVNGYDLFKYAAVLRYSYLHMWQLFMEVVNKNTVLIKFPSGHFWTTWLFRRNMYIATLGLKNGCDFLPIMFNKHKS